jgi:hypothetical protein
MQFDGHMRHNVAQRAVMSMTAHDFPPQIPAASAVGIAFTLSKQN